MSQLHAVMTPSTLRNRIASVYGGWSTSRAARDYSQIANTPLLRGILSQQNARFRELDDKSRFPRLEIAWMEACNNTAALKTGVYVRGVPCDFSGWLVGSNKMEILIDNRIEESFDIPAEIFPDQMFTPEQMFALGLSRAVKNLQEKLNAHLLANLIQWAGVNKYQKVFGRDGGADANSAWKITKIPVLNTYERSLNAYLTRVAGANRFINPVLYEGGALTVSELVPQNQDRFQFGSNQIVSDPTAFAAQSVDNNLFYVAQGAVALFTVNNQTSSPTDYGIAGNGMIGVARPLGDLRDANGNAITYDLYVVRKRRAMDSVDYQGLNVDNRCEFVDSYRLEVNFKCVLNPLACGDKTTGIINLLTDSTLPAYLSPDQIARTVAYDPSNPGATVAR